MPSIRIKVFPPHLDAPLSRRQAELLVAEPSAVARHPFMPFLQRNQHWTKFSRKGTRPEDVEVKDRPIRYASRRDSYIFAYYRDILCQAYESEIKQCGLQNCVLAYRHIPTETGRGGKSNIHFARDAFETIKRLGSCTVLALDIKSFFENLDHEYLRRMWARLLKIRANPQGRLLLPVDHYHVFRAVTKYSYIDRDQAYLRLGFIGEKATPEGRKKIGYLQNRKTFPPQICSPADFRTKLKDLIKINPNSFGIPQGSPISDLLANLYMLDFDHRMMTMLSLIGGTYMRYSDDILLIIPSQPGMHWKDLMDRARCVLHDTAPNLLLKDGKTQVYEYRPLPNGHGLRNQCLHATRSPDGLEYLGFRFDGQHVFLRNSTVSGFRRRATSITSQMARRHIQLNPNSNLEELIDSFNYSALFSKFGRVEDFYSKRGYKHWTFWTYAKRAASIFGESGTAILDQAKTYKEITRKTSVNALRNAYSRQHR